ncbi:hypothetical protein K0504_10145 [Neiella marina]|uniref:Transposase n=1 Tax=Neiella holothuriorum TaxID=2870530 RepID=A0ABS7EGR3_9GAMM|nr:hypothetical protein [Neiella holothuriorum]MBW8191399.1 hypothetical protein [Neiella holothuriorum]
MATEHQRRVLRTDVIPNQDLVEIGVLSDLRPQQAETKSHYKLNCPQCGESSVYRAHTTHIVCSGCGNVPIIDVLTATPMLYKKLKLAGVSLGPRFAKSELVSSMPFDDLLSRLQPLPQQLLQLLHGIGLSSESCENSLFGWIDETQFTRTTSKEISLDQHECWLWLKHSKRIAIPFVDGHGLNGVILPSSIELSSSFQSLPFDLVKPTRFARIWLQQARALGKRVIVISNPLYAAHLLAQGKPAVLIHNKDSIGCKLSKWDQRQCYVFREDERAQELLNGCGRVINEYGNESQSIWQRLLAVNLNRNTPTKPLDSQRAQFIEALSKKLNATTPLNSAIESLEREMGVRLLVRPHSK